MAELAKQGYALAQQHLNWTWVIAVMLRVALGAISMAIDPSLEFDNPLWILDIASIAVVFIVTLWVLGEKNRSLLWVFTIIAAPFLENRSGKLEEDEEDAD